MTNCNHDHAAPLGDEVQIGRRKFIKLASVAGGAALFAPAMPAFAKGSADALVLACMDYRLADDVHTFMTDKGMADKYDFVVLAGASAGVLHDDFAAWHDTFWTHLDVAIDLHGIHTVMVIDHRDCGAYKIAFGPEHAADRDAETKLHTEMMAIFKTTLQTRKPDLEFEGYLMAIDGTVEELEV